MHGLGSNPDTTWRAKRLNRRRDSALDPLSIDSKYVNWVSEFLPSDLPINAREDTRVFFYNYDSYWKRDALHTRLSVLGDGLLERVRMEIRSTEEVRHVVCYGVQR